MRELSKSIKKVLPDWLVFTTTPRTHVVSFICAAASFHAMQVDVDADEFACDEDAGRGVAVFIGRTSSAEVVIGTGVNVG